MAVDSVEYRQPTLSPNFTAFLVSVLHISILVVVFEFTQLSQINYVVFAVISTMLFIVALSLYSPSKSAFSISILSLLIVSIAVSPRIPIDFIQPGQRRFDIRLEDLVLMCVLLLWALNIKYSSEFELPNYVIAFTTYLCVGVLTTLLGIYLYDVNLLRGLFYWLKEFQYILLSLLVFNLVNSKEELKYVIGLFLLAGIVNGLWAVYQLVTGNFGPLLSTPPGVAFSDGDAVHYGTTLVGEFSAFSSGGLYVFPIILTIAILQVNQKYNVISLIVLLILIIGLVGSSSRVSIIAVVTGSTVIYLNENKISKQYFSFLALSFTAAIFISRIVPSGPLSRFEMSSIIRGVSTRFSQWEGILINTFPELMLGFGKGSLPQIISHEEAHNYYIRLAIETGLVGLLLFLLTMLIIVRFSVSSAERNQNFVKVIGLTCFGTTIGMLTMAIFQDAFIPVKVAQYYWILVGATVASYMFSTNTPRKA